MAFDLKGATPDASFTLATAFLFGADTQAATNPSIYAASTVRDAVLASIVAAANTWAATQTFSPAVNTSGVTVSGYSLTGANAQSALSIAGTWNTSGAPSAIDVNLTNTASGASSKFLDLRFASTSVFSIMRNGNIVAPGAIQINTGAGGDFFRAQIGSGTMRVLSASEGGYQWGDASNSSLALVDDAADVLAQRRSTNAQTYRWYRTYTNSTNYERGALQTGSGYIEMAAQSQGTGTANLDIRLTPAGTGVARSAASLLAHSGTAIPAGGTAGAGLLVSSTANFGVFFGSGAPTLSAARGSLYLRSDGAGTTDRAYINSNGTTGWTALTTAA
jgi:hypothetical protein